jgi:hypothetical protein
MTVTIDYTLICELARQEFGGKFTIVGLFPNGIGMPHVPFPLPFLTFYNALRVDGPGAYKFHGKLSQLATGESLAQAQGMIQTLGAGPVILPVAFPNVQFKAFGSYTWAMEFEGQDEPFLTEFQLSHVPMTPPPGVPGAFKF